MENLNSTTNNQEEDTQNQNKTKEALILPKSNINYIREEISQNIVNIVTKIIPSHFMEFKQILVNEELKESYQLSVERSKRKTIEKRVFLKIEYSFLQYLEEHRQFLPLLFIPVPLQAGHVFNPVYNFNIRHNLRMFFVKKKQKHHLTSLCLIILIAGLAWRTIEDDDYAYYDPPPEMITKKTIHDGNIEYHIYTNPHDNEFIFIISNSSIDQLQNVTPGLYVSNDGFRTFQVRHPKLNGQPIYTTHIISTKNHMFCISKINLTFYYIDKKLAQQHMHKYEENEDIIPHPTIEGYVLKMVPESSTKHIMLILDISNNYSEVVRHENVKGAMFLSDSSVLFQYTKRVNHFVNIHGHYYIEIRDRDGVNCLFTSHDRSEYFIRLTCDLESETTGRTSVAFHPLLPGIIYANLKIGKNTYTHISMNYGKNFSAMKFIKKPSLCDDGSCHVKLNLPTITQNHQYFQKEWIAAFDIVDNFTIKHIGRHLISFDGGQNWKSVPFSHFYAQILNQGGIAMGLNQNTRKIIYTFDEGNTYYHHNFYGPGEVFVSGMKTGKLKNESFNSYDKIDRTCENDDYLPWDLPTENGLCFQGRNISYKKKKLSSLCVDTEPYLKILTSKPCPCSLDDYRW
ncbi:hypothetical protein RF11_11018 [Thelohanellus kitauei]|uniref:VPS10 domain-containing protein n=1 Tax=Thelohanellus kitauei TaxID=669202 RepID=A0A0C2NBK7_THEKT|nr:hypothetical protein RF11_11018 [Thelohanellus kitauei]